MVRACFEKREGDEVKNVLKFKVKGRKKRGDRKERGESKKKKSA